LLILNIQLKYLIQIQNTIKACQGFVLTEILVVSVIVGILASVAIPVYTGYVKDQRLAAAKNIAGSTAAAANIYYRRTGSAPICHPIGGPITCVELLKIFLTDPANYSIDIDDRKAIVVDSYHSGIADTVGF
jgi:prepilin-type N-terminal cleavage/methylation domain-containing protein